MVMTLPSCAAIVFGVWPYGVAPYRVWPCRVV
jgi:hypothetical protein